MFNSRNINKEMNKELENHIVKVLELNLTPENNYLTINKKIEELNKVKDQLENIKQLTEKACWHKWAENLNEDFKGYKENQIYVLYLTRDGSKVLQEQSWEIDGVNYQESFSNRYIHISFRDNILQWLKDYVLPNCRIKDVYLKSMVRYKMK